MNIPPRSSKGSPPRRAALYERSDSHTNERAAPTLRIIGNPQAPIYASSPFPTKPSQILSPSVYNGQKSTFDPPEGAVHDKEQYGDGENDTVEPLNTATQNSPYQGTNATRDTFYIPVQENIPVPYTSATLPSMDDCVENDPNRLSDDIVQLPSISSQLEDSEQYGEANQVDTPRQPASKESDGSLSSSNSTGTVIVRKHRDGRKHASYSAFPNTARPGSSKSNLSLSTLQKSVPEDTSERESPISPLSPNSFFKPNDPLSHERRVSSVPPYASSHVSSQSSVNVQYPVIRPPSASASW